MINGTSKVPKDTKKGTIVDGSGSRHELTQNVDNVGDIRTNYTKIDNTANKMAIVSGILNRSTICGTKTKVKIHRSGHRMVINKIHTIKNVLNVFVWREVVAIRCGGDFNPMKEAKRT
jgi:hypothetical protein